MKKLLSLSWLPLNADAGLLFLRVTVSWLMIRYHGWGKLTGWADERMRTPNLFSLAGAGKYSLDRRLGLDGTGKSKNLKAET